MALLLAGQKITADLLRAFLGALFEDVAGENKIATDQSTTSTTYTDLATVGPTVTITSTGDRALLLWSCGVYNTTAASGAGATIAISGDTTLAAADANGIVGGDEAGTGLGQEAANYSLVAINPGTNTFTMKYRATANTARFLRRRLLVIAP